jgi:hypothetical protein
VRHRDSAEVIGAAWLAKVAGGGIVRSPPSSIL